MQAMVAMAVAGALAAGSAEAAVRVVHVRRPAPVVVARTPLLRVTTGTVVAVKAGQGRLRVEVQPERARVYLDGRYQGRGDLLRTLRAGRHTVRVVLNDGREAAQTVHVDAGRLTLVRLEL